MWTTRTVYSICKTFYPSFLHFHKENVSLLKPPRKTKLVTPHVNKFFNVLCFFLLLRYTVKKVSDIPVPCSRGVTYQTLSHLIISAHGEFGKWHSGWGRDVATFYTVYAAADRQTMCYMSGITGGSCRGHQYRILYCIGLPCKESALFGTWLGMIRITWGKSPEWFGRNPRFTKGH